MDGLEKERGVRPEHVKTTPAIGVEGWIPADCRKNSKAAIREPGKDGPSFPGEAFCHSEGRMDLSGKIAIVTGAARGLGWAIAERLARDGVKLVLAEVDLV